MYRLTNIAGQVQRIADGLAIPEDPENRDYVEYLAWLDLGNAPAAADPLPTASPTEQIEALERQYLLPRVAREFMLTIMENEARERASSLGMTQAQALAYLRSENTGYRKAKELDEQIRALRALL